MASRRHNGEMGKMIFRGKKRWTIKVFYTDDSADLFQIDEIKQLHDIIENGRSFEEIKNIMIEYNYGRKNTS